MQFEYLIFDLDGTIADPREGIVKSFNYALCSLGHAGVEEQVICTFIGPPLDEAFERVTGVKDSKEIANLVRKYRERYAEKGFSENRLYPDIAETLKRLKEKGYILGVCTTKRKDFADAILTLFDIGGCFAFVDGGDIGISKRRQLEGLLERGEITSNSIMIGDRSIDLSAARRNGLAAAGVLWGYGSREELAGEDPDYLFETPGELLNAFPMRKRRQPR